MYAFSSEESRVKWKYFRNILKTGENKCYHTRIKLSKVRKMILDGKKLWNIFKLLLNFKFCYIISNLPHKKRPVRLADLKTYKFITGKRHEFVR